jgi:hypothetical protein
VEEVQEYQAALQIHQLRQCCSARQLDAAAAVAADFYAGPLLDGADNELRTLHELLLSLDLQK